MAGELHPDEGKRWMLLLGFPMLLACIFMGATLGTGESWLLALPLVFGPGVGVVAIAYLAISSDTNGGSTVAAMGEVAELTPALQPVLAA